MRKAGASLHERERLALQEIDAFKEHGIYVPEESSEIEIFDGPWDSELLQLIEKHIPPKDVLRSIEGGNHQGTPHSSVQLQPGKHDLLAVKCALSPVVERIVEQNSIEFSMSAHAPENFAELAAASSSRLVVFSEFSFNTIWGEPSSNHAQRAWHDHLHLRLFAGTDWRGELRVARTQAAEIGRLVGDQLADWVWGDLWGATMHMALYGRFPLAQVQFVNAFLTTGLVLPF